MTDHSAMGTPREGFWKRFGGFLMVTFTVIAGLSAAFSYHVSQENKTLTLKQSAAMYRATSIMTKLADGKQANDVILTAAATALLPETVTVTPRFEVPELFSDEASLGDEIVLKVGNGRDVLVATQGENTVLTIVSMGDKVCRSGDVSRKLCEKKFPILGYYIQLSFDGGEAYSPRLVADPNF